MQVENLSSFLWLLYSRHYTLLSNTFASPGQSLYFQRAAIAGRVENTALQFGNALNWALVNLQPVASWIDCVYGSAAANVLLLRGMNSLKPQWWCTVAPQTWNSVSLVIFRAKSFQMKTNIATAACHIFFRVTDTICSTVKHPFAPRFTLDLGQHPSVRGCMQFSQGTNTLTTNTGNLPTHSCYRLDARFSTLIASFYGGRGVAQSCMCFMKEFPLRCPATGSDPPQHQTCCDDVVWSVGSQCSIMFGTSLQWWHFAADKSQSLAWRTWRFILNLGPGWDLNSCGRYSSSWDIYRLVACEVDFDDAASHLFVDPKNATRARYSGSKCLWLPQTCDW